MEKIMPESDSPSPPPWDERLAEVVKLLIAVGDMPMPGIVRDFIRAHARAELAAFMEAER